VHQHVHQHNPLRYRVKRQASRGRRVFGGFVAASALVIGMTTACSSGTPATTAAPAGTAASGPAAPSTSANLAPLKLGHFPATTDGRLARTICKQWAGLRQQYVSRVAADTPYQLNQWFSSRAWSKVQNDSMALGDDPAYSKLETAIGVAIFGDSASASSAKSVDKACEAAD